MTNNNEKIVPDKFSPVIDIKDGDQKKHKGLIKVRLAHSEGASFLIPEILIGLSGTRYFLPSFFGPPLIGSNVEPELHLANFSIDVGNPKSKILSRFIIRVKSNGLIKSYDDGAQLFECEYEAPKKILDLVSGSCRRMTNGDYAIKVFHHTIRESAKKIKESNELWSSSWNLAGTRELANIAYTYFTSLPALKNEDDLHRVAMASNEILKLQTTSDRAIEKILDLKVRRGDTKDRTAALPFFVPTELISPYPLRFHPPSKGNPAYYECVGAEIIRVGVKPTKKLSLNQNNVSIFNDDKKTFDYIVRGEANTLEGLEAPYKEEDTKCIAHLQKLNNKTNFFDFWKQNENSDQVSGRKFEPRILKPTVGG